MKFLVEMSHTVTLVIEASSEDVVQDFISCTTPQEVLDLVGDTVVDESYNETILNKLPDTASAHYTIIENCPLGGDISNDCADCVYSNDYHFVDGECMKRGD